MMAKRLPVLLSVLLFGLGVESFVTTSLVHPPIKRFATTRQQHDTPRFTSSRIRTRIHLSASDGIAAEGQEIDPLILRTSQALRASSWFSWWSQLILTVVSTITFVFARNVLQAQASSSPVEVGRIAAKFLLPGVSLMASTVSLMWTWGERRLARRLVRKRVSSRVETANLLRRVVKVGVSLNLVGLLTGVLGAQYIIGTLAAKSLTSFAGFGATGGLVTQTLQPLDVLVVQANTNILAGHVVGLACLLWLVRLVDLLDPPSLEDDP